MRIIHADVRDGLAQLPDNSIQGVITSPPYFGLRKYAGVEPSVWGGDPNCQHQFQTQRYYTEQGASSVTAEAFSTAGEDNAQRLKVARWKEDATCSDCQAWKGCLGNEPTPDLFIAHLVEVFQGIKRVLRDDGVCWINMGSSYCSGTSTPRKTSKTKLNHGYWKNDNITERVNVQGLPAKNDLLIPDRLRLALQADGWIIRVRSMPWIKRSCMPGSQQDRPTVATEDWIMVTKGPRYFWDPDGCRRENTSVEQLTHNLKYAKSYQAYDERAATTGQPGNVNNAGIHARPGGSGRTLRTTDAYFDSLDDLIAEQRHYLAHLERIRESGGILLDHDGDPLALDVVAAGSDREHYASYPEGVVVPLVQGSTSEYGCCSMCGAPWKRIVDKKRQPSVGRGHQGYAAVGNQQDNYGGMPAVEVQTLGWRPTCSHQADIVPCTVLDIFLGSGTTLVVAKKLGRDGIGIETSQTYVTMAQRRLDETNPSLPMTSAPPESAKQLTFGSGSL